MGTGEVLVCVWCVLGKKTFRVVARAVTAIVVGVYVARRQWEYSGRKGVRRLNNT